MCIPEKAQARKGDLHQPQETQALLALSEACCAPGIGRKPDVVQRALEVLLEACDRSHPKTDPKKSKRTRGFRWIYVKTSPRKRRGKNGRPKKAFVSGMNKAWNEQQPLLCVMVMAPLIGFVPLVEGPWSRGSSPSRTILVDVGREAK